MKRGRQELADVGKAFLEVAHEVSQTVKAKTTRGPDMHLKVFATAVMEMMETPKKS